MEQKQNYMILLIIGILSSLLTNSCGKEDIERISIKSYIYTNNSGHSLSIMSWKGSNTDIFDLIQSQKIEFRYEFNGGGCFINGINEPNSSAIECLLVSSDSLKIIFDDNKTLIFKPEGERNINILNEDNYEYSQNGNNELFKYGFSEKDYLEAN